MDADIKIFSYEILVFYFWVEANAPFHVFVFDLNLEVVEVLSGIYYKTWLVELVAYAKPHFGPEKHKSTFCKVVLNVLKGGHECDFVNDVVVNLLQGCDLDPDISLLVRYLAPHVIKAVVLFPLTPSLIPMIIMIIIFTNLIHSYTVGTPYD